jgi:hypothetical protein
MHLFIESPEAGHLIEICRGKSNDIVNIVVLLILLNV